MPASRGYPGDLGSAMTPRPQKPYPTSAEEGALVKLMFPDLQEAKAEWKAWTEEYTRRFELLFAHFHIEVRGPDAWLELAVRLAEAHVPGLKPARPKGKRGPKKFKDSSEARLARQALLGLVATYRKGGKLSFESAFRFFAATQNRKRLPPYYQKRARLSPSLLKLDFGVARDEVEQELRRQDAEKSMQAIISRLGHTPSLFPPGYVPSGGLLGLARPGEQQGESDTTQPPDK